jgi:hypothetical protein
MSYQVTSRRLCHSVLNVYGPDEDKMITHTDSFYEELQQASCQFIKYRVKILLTGFEVKLQTEDISKPTNRVESFLENNNSKGVSSGAKSLNLLCIIHDRSQ